MKGHLRERPEGSGNWYAVMTSAIRPPASAGASGTVSMPGGSVRRRLNALG